MNWDIINIFFLMFVLCLLSYMDTGGILPFTLSIGLGIGFLLYIVMVITRHRLSRVEREIKKIIEEDN